MKGKWGNEERRTNRVDDDQSYILVEQTEVFFPGVGGGTKLVYFVFMALLNDTNRDDDDDDVTSRLVAVGISLVGFRF